MATFEEQYKKYSTSGQGQAINDMYDAKQQSQLNQLESAYQASRSEAEAARERLPGQYQQQANDLSAQYERNRRNFNMQAAGAGLNSGTASQAALAQNSAYQRDMGALRTSQAEAMYDADRNIAELERQYQANVSSAIADNDYQRAQSLLNEYNNGYTRDLNTAKTLAAYGDFSGYASLYGQDTANSMAALWRAQNPDLAYNTGRMSAEEYKAITGKYPAGYTAPYTPYAPVPVPGDNNDEVKPSAMSAIINGVQTAGGIDRLGQMAGKLSNIGVLNRMSEEQYEAYKKALTEAKYRLLGYETV